MNEIIKKIAGYCNQIATFKKTPWHELSTDEQLSLIQEDIYEKLKKVIKHQKLDDDVLILLINGSFKEETDYKLLCRYYKRYGFSNYVKNYLLMRNVEKIELPLVLDIVGEYGFGCREEKSGEVKLSSTVDEVFELLSYRDDEVSEFFASTRTWFGVLQACRRADAMRQGMLDAVLYRSATTTFEGPFDFFLGNELEPTTEELLADYRACFPTHEIQNAVLATRNEKWIGTLDVLIEEAIEVAVDVFKEFDESLLSEYAKKLLNVKK